MPEPTIDQLMRRLTEKGFVTPKTVDRLKRRIEKNPDEATPQRVVSWLVANNYLTKDQAKRVLAEEPTPAAPKSRKPAPPTKDRVSDLLADELPTLPKNPLGALLEELAPLQQPTPLGAELPGGGLQSVAQWESMGTTLGLPGAAPPKKKVKVTTSVWDTKLILLGGGGLILLFLISGALLWLLNRGSGDAAFQKAEEDYGNASYTNAINKYNQFLKSYPRHSSASLARVHLGMARIRQVADSKQWAKALQQTQSTLASIRKEKDFASARSELAVILPKIAEGLAEEAREKKDASLAAQSRKALELYANANYVPKNARNEPKMREIQAALALVERDLQRDRTLREAVTKIQEAGSRGDAAAAYALRKDLLKEYPDLAVHPSLQQAILAVAQAERTLVKFVREPQTALTAEPEGPAAAVAIPAQPSGNPAPQVEGYVLPVLASGAAYGLDATSGRVLWRRFVGADTTFVPQPVAAQPGADFVLLDSVRNELVRIDAQGQLRWRLPLGESAALSPLFARERVVVATRFGRVDIVNLADGTATGQIRLPQGVAVPPAASGDGRSIFLIGRQASLYVVSLDSGACKHVAYLGHESGVISAAPVTVGDFLLVTQATGKRTSQLRVLRIKDAGESLELLQELPLDGLVREPPVTAERTVAVGTDSGSVYVFDVSPEAKKAPLTAVAVKRGAPSQAGIPWVFLRGTDLWIADTAFTRLDVQTAAGRLVPKWVQDERDEFFRTLQVIGGVAFHVRQKQNSAGLCVSAVDAQQGSRFWETQLAPPPANSALLDPARQKATLLTTTGTLYEIDLTDIRQQSVWAPQAAVATTRPLVARQPIRHLSDGRWVATTQDEPQQVLVHDPARPDMRLSWRPLPQQVAVAPLALQNMLLFPGLVGQVLCLDVDTGRLLAEPFQPRLAAGQEIHWQPPADADPPDAKDLLLFDGQKTLYLLGVISDPKARLTVFAQADVKSPLTTPIARVGNLAYAVDASGTLLSFVLPELKPGATFPVTGQVTFGPVRVGQFVFLATDEGQVWCVDDQQRQKWQVTIESALFAGPPAAAQEAVVLATVDGSVIRLAAADGRVVNRVELRQPLVGSPAIWQDRVIVTGYDSTLHVVTMKTP